MALQDMIEPMLDPEMMALWEQFEAGERKGKLDGERTVLLRLLGQRFGTLPPSAIARIEAATMLELDAMTLRVLTAGSVEEVLGQSTHAAI